MSRTFARQELEVAGFPAATRELVFAVPVEQLGGDGVAELDLEVTVAGVDGQARMAVGYLPGGPVTAGQQLIRDGESRVLRKQLVKPGGVLVVALDQPGYVDVRSVGARGFDDAAECPLGVDEEAVEESLAGDDQYEEGEVFGADDQVVKAIGAAAAGQADRVAVMNGVLKRLEALYVTAKSTRSSSFLLATGESADQALASSRNNLDYLAGPGFARVVAGELQLSSGNPDAPAWLELANSVGKNLQSITGDVEKWDLSSVVAQVAPKVGENLAAAAKEGVSALHWVVVGLGLWLAIKVLS